jgi:hypothetical protein
VVDVAADRALGVGRDEINGLGPDAELDLRTRAEPVVRDASRFAGRQLDRGVRADDPPQQVGRADEVGDEP